MQRITIAGVQMAVEPKKVNQNIERCIHWIEKAVQTTSAKLIVFPESITTGFVPGMSPQELWELVDFLPGKISEPIAAVAKKHGVYVVFPTYERGENKNIVYNSAALIGPQGNLIGVYRKTHPFPSEQVWTTPGKQAPVFQTEIGKIGIMICYDGDFPELARVMVLKGAEILIRPAAFLRSADIWTLTNQARAYDNHVYMIGVNAIGTDAGCNWYFGNSMIVSPIAQILARGRSQEEIIFAELDPNPLQYVSYGCTSPMLFNHIEDRNVAAYEGILHSANSPFPKFVP